MAPPEQQALWTAVETAAYLRLPSVETLYTWRKRKYGPRASRIGRHLLYDADEVRAWFKQQQAA
jgi:hypothetical protein